MLCQALPEAFSPQTGFAWRKFLNAAPKCFDQLELENFISVYFLSFINCRQHSLIACVYTQYLLFHFSYLLWNVLSWTWWSPIISLKVWAWTFLRKAWAPHSKAWVPHIKAQAPHSKAWAPHNKTWALTGRPELLTGPGLLSGPGLLTGRCGLHQWASSSCNGVSTPFALAHRYLLFLKTVNLIQIFVSGWYENSSKKDLWFMTVSEWIPH